MIDAELILGCLRGYLLAHEVVPHDIEPTVFFYKFDPELPPDSVLCNTWQLSGVTELWGDEIRQELTIDGPETEGFWAVVSVEDASSGEDKLLVTRYSRSSGEVSSFLADVSLDIVASECAVPAFFDVDYSIPLFVVH